MTPPRSATGRKADFRISFSEGNGHSNALKLKRLAHEETQKAAGLWGEMSVGYLERNGAAFVYFWKAATPSDVYKLASKRPKEIVKAEHEALCAWLKVGRYEGFSQTIFAWNVSVAEASRIRLELIGELASQGKRVINV